MDNNEKRIKISLGALSPAEYRESLGIKALPVQVFSRPPPGSLLGGNQQLNPVQPVRSVHSPLCKSERSFSPYLAAS